MSYRTYAEGAQIFGNNEYYPVWLEFVASQGIDVDPEGCYAGNISDFTAALEACERIVFSLEDQQTKAREKLPESMAKRFPSLFDLSSIAEKTRNPPADQWSPRLFDELCDLVESGLLFIPIAFFLACRNKLEPDPDCDTRSRAYRLKPGETIRIEAG